MHIETVKVVQFLCDLSESPDEVFNASKIGPERDSELQYLAGLGAIEPGPRPETIVCDACDADHPAVIEFDAERRCYVHFCPEAGLVTVNDADLITHRFRPGWLVDWLVKEIPFTSPVRPRAIVPECAWHLGDTKCGDTLVTAVFARRVGGQLALGQLAAALRSVHPADKGIVITTSLNTVRAVPLPDGYEFIHLPDLVVSMPNRLAMDHDRFASCIRGMPSRTAKGARTREGRPSQGSMIVKIFDLRRARGNPVAGVSAEARAIIDEWTDHAPDQMAPAFSTVRAHVTKLKTHPLNLLDIARK
jgi:hypothetical protein